MYRSIGTYTICEISLCHLLAIELYFRHDLHLADKALIYDVNHGFAGGPSRAGLDTGMLLHILPCPNHVTTLARHGVAS